MIHAISANREGSQRSTESDKDDDRNSIPIVGGEHKENCLRHKSGGVEKLPGSRGVQVALRLKPIGEWTSEKENDSEHQVRHCCDETTIGKIEVKVI